MSKYVIPEINGTGVDEILTPIVANIPIFIPLFLFFIFGVVFITGYRKQKLDSGVGDAPLWATLGGIVSSIVALFLTLGNNLIDLPTLTITIVVTIGFAMWLFASKDRI